MRVVVRTLEVSLVVDALVDDGTAVAVELDATVVPVDATDATVAGCSGAFVT